MYKRQNTPLFLIGWLLIAIGAFFMFTSEERREVLQLLMSAVDALEQRDRMVSENAQAALKQEAAYVAE